MTIQIKNTKDIENHKLKILVYGESGAGKTTFSATGENSLIISAENGLLSVRDKQIDYISLNDYPNGERIAALGAALKHAMQSSYEWIILDSITEIAQTLVAELQIKYPSKKESMNLWSDYNNKIISIIKAFRDLDKNVVFTALSKADKDEQGQRFIGIDMQGSISNKISAMFDEVFYLTKVNTEDGESKRVLIVDGDEKLITKDRSNKLSRIEKPDLAYIKEKVFK